MRIHVTKAPPRSVETTFEFLDRDDALVARLTGTRFRAVPLGRADRPDDLVYRTESVPLPLTDAPSAALTAVPHLRDIANPETIAEESELEETLLLVEALVRAIALESLRGFADADGTISPTRLVAAGRLAENALPLAMRLLQGLADAELASAPGEDATAETGTAPRDWHLAAPDDHPAAADLLRTIALEAPDHIAEIVLLARLHTDLAMHLGNGLPESADATFAAPLMEHLLTASPSHAPLSDAVHTAVERLAVSWPAREPMRVLLIGALDATLAERLARLLDSFVGATLVITDPDDAILSRAARRWSGKGHVSTIRCRTFSMHRTWSTASMRW